MPGGSPVSAQTAWGGDDATTDVDADGIPELTLRFDRRLVLASIRAGVAAGDITLGTQVPISLYNGATLLGTDYILVR